MISSVPGNYNDMSTDDTTTPQKAPESAADQSKADTLQLSKSAQAILLKHQGVPVAQIASTLGMDLKTVDSLLGTTPAPDASSASQVVETAAKDTQIQGVVGQAK
jgi:hypothetical protein